MRYWMVVGFALGAWTGAARAADPTPELQAFVATPAHQAEALKAAQASGLWQDRPCAAASFSPSHATSVLEPVTFGKAGPTGGVWQEQVVATGCGARVALNVGAVAEGAGRLRLGPMLPGDTHADMLLQTDAAKVAQAVNGVRKDGCTRTYFADTAFIAYDPPDAQGRRAWRERWAIASCGQPTTMVVQFVPDSNGGTFIKIDPSDVTH